MAKEINDYCLAEGLDVKKENLNFFLKYGQTLHEWLTFVRLTKKIVIADFFSNFFIIFFGNDFQ